MTEVKHSRSYRGQDMKKVFKNPKRRGLLPETVDTFEYRYKTNRLLYYILGPLIISISKFAWKFKVEGKENLPKNMHSILMPNHVSHFDSFCTMIPLWPKKPFHFIADEKLFKNRYFAWFAKQVNVFPIRKGAKQVDVVKYAINLVNNGSSLLWYPEGQRHKNPSENKLNPGKLGSGWIATRTKVPIIPVFLHGPEFVMPVGKGVGWGKRPRSITLTIKYGKPVYLDDLRDLPSSKETSKLAVDRILESIDELRLKGSYIKY
jgi:1-acyl-sn-glycerol-3-phosphate acyltransferase